MIKKLSPSTVIFVTTLLIGCSWKETFVIKNTTENAVNIHYLLKDYKGILSIFGNKPNAYQLDKLNRIDWYSEISLTDKDTSVTGIDIVLPPHAILVFGELSNDRYTNKDQYFINGRTFNFKMMELEMPDNLVRITDATFDD